MCQEALFASTHVWANLWVAMFVMGVRSFCLFLPPISPISLMPPLSLTHSTFFYLSVCNMCCGGPSLHVAAGWISLRGQPALSAVILTWLFFFFAAEITKRSVSPPSSPLLPRSLVSLESAVNHKRRWLPCSLIESTFSSDARRSEKGEEKEK